MGVANRVKIVENSQSGPTRARDVALSLHGLAKYTLDLGTWRIVVNREVAGDGRGVPSRRQSA
jgi:hypothetical protein